MCGILGLQPIESVHWMPDRRGEGPKGYPPLSATQTRKQKPNMDVKPIDPFANYNLPATFQSQTEQQMFAEEDPEPETEPKTDPDPESNPEPEADPRDEVITQLQAAIVALTAQNAGLRAANAALILAAPAAEGDPDEVEINPDDTEPEIDDLFK